MYASAPYTATTTLVSTEEPSQPPSPEENPIKQFSFKTHIGRLCKLLDEYENWGDTLSENLRTWAGRTYLHIRSEGFKANENKNEYIAKRINKLLEKKLINSFDRAPLKNSPVPALGNPVLERRWTWESLMLDDYLSCWKTIFPGMPPRSPFDLQVMQPRCAHVFANEIKEWAKTFLIGTGQISECLAASENQERSLELYVKRYTQEEAEKRYMFYEACARDADFRETGRNHERETKKMMEDFAQQVSIAKERIRIERSSTSFFQNSSSLALGSREDK